MAGRLRIECEDAGLMMVRNDGLRRHVDIEAEQLRRWVDRYYDRGGQSWDRLALGEEIFRVLDGDERWLTDALTGTTTMEFSGRGDDPASHSFFDVPWELLRGSSGWIVDQSVSIVRHVSRATNRSSVSVAPPSRYRLLILFMAGAPHEVESLSVEWEEERILRATARGRAEHAIDLIVEETGMLDQMRRRLALEDGAVGHVAPDVLHLSCHGGLSKEDGRPVVLLEDAHGGSDEVDAERLVAALAGRAPRLVFLSASASASSSRAFPALVQSLVAAGIPAALGWAGQVYDERAIAAASELYSELANGCSVELAVGRARSRLRVLDDEAWHRLRLYLGSNGSQPLVRGSEQPSHLRTKADRGDLIEKTLWIGRRRTVQTVLRALSAGRPVIVHGQRGMGKSSLAARIADRLSDHSVVALLVRGDSIREDDILDAFVRVSRDAEPLRELRCCFKRGELAFRDVLSQLLTEHYGLGVLGPVLFVIDDMERILDIRSLPLPSIRPPSNGVVAALVEAFAAHGPAAKLLMTSRYAFRVDGTEGGGEEPSRTPDTVSLAGMSRTELTRLALTLVAACGRAPLPTFVVEQTVEAAAGNPGLVGLLTRMATEDTEAWERTTLAVTSYLQGEADALGMPEVAGLLESLPPSASELVAALSAPERSLLETLMIFQIPVPLGAELDKLVPNASLARLVGLGMIERTLDWGHDRNREAVMVAPFARPFVRVPSLDFQARALGHLFTPLLDSWSGALPLVVEQEVFRLGRLVGHPGAVAASAGAVLNALHLAAKYREGARLAQEALELLDEAGHAPPPLLRWKAAEHFFSVGRVKRALALVESAPDTSGPVQAGLLWVRGRIQMARGELTRARQSLEGAKELLHATNDVRAAAVISGDLLRLCWIRGDVEGGRRLAEERLAIFEQTGDGRSRAVAWEDMVDLGMLGRSHDDSRRWHGDALAFHEHLGDTRARANTLCRIGRARMSRGELDDALLAYEEALVIFEGAGDLHSLGVASADVARLHEFRGEFDRAEELHRRSLEIFERLEDVRSRAITLGDIARIRASKGDVDEALALYLETLATFDELEDVRSRAITLGDIARIRVDKGEVDEALALDHEAVAMFETLGDARSRAVTLGDIARILVSKGEVDEALELHREMLAVFDGLGDKDGRAHTLWSIGRIALARGNGQQAYDALAESYQLNLERGRLEGIVGVGVDLGRLLAAAGHHDEAIIVLERSAAGLARIGRDVDAHGVQSMLERLRSMINS